ncbi:hypothetical protein PV08_00032 [Exophiala spinifera]|uniref:Magnesium and cobalt transporter CorA n=1 Tax=Exophiala spinifera TaxID=91928 RepID=A0A0D2BLL9_9EURO|nr:uncharacterized protein PV08_00032 [Exophiala spinifera]KIW19460.1 hypothetical protein PV08_00032 [Exophiala spinifera]
MSVYHDGTHHGAFKDLLDHSGAPTMSTDEYKIAVLDVALSSTGEFSRSSLGFTTTSTLVKGQAPALRVIFAPLDYPDSGTASTLLTLFEHFSIPTTFLYERVQSVTHSFGHEELDNGAFRSWFHFLCKAIEPKHDNILWLRSAYFLRRDEHGLLTLICFGASNPLVQRLESLPKSVWDIVLTNPFNLFNTILADLHRQVDEQLWTLNRYHAIDSTVATSDFDQNWVELHYIAKNIIHIKEAVDAVLRTISHIVRAQSEGGVAGTAETRKTNLALHYSESLFESVDLRAISMEKRMQNVINLSFNLVAQKDSSRIKTESSSMHTIALTTLIFLPISTVASIFGSAFFDFNGGNTEDMSLSRHFWVFWVISVPLTVAVLTVWIYFHPSNVWRWPGLKRTRKFDRDAYQMLDLTKK